MSKKIARNSICPNWNSGLKYKLCCGKHAALKGSTLRYFGPKVTAPSEFETDVYDALGYYPDDYINPIRASGDVLYVLIDESNIGDYYAVSGIAILKSEIDNNIKIKGDLIKLVEKYDIDYIHFTDIYGRKKTLGNRRKLFIKEYINLVRTLKMKAFSVCMNQKEIEDYLSTDELTKEQCYMAITWRMMFDILVYGTSLLGSNLIVEMWRENDNVTNEKRILHQKNIKGLVELFPFASVYRHYILFMKEELLFSSLSDFVAYITICTYPKLVKGYDRKKLVNDCYELLTIYNGIFFGEKGLRDAWIDGLVEATLKRQNSRNH